MPANETIPNGRRLESWKEIAAYLNREVRTAIRWEKERGLPVHRIPGKRSGVYALASEVDAWLRTEAVGLSNGGAPEVRPMAPQAGLRKRGLWTAASAATVVFGIAALLLSVSAIRPATPQLLNPDRVTNDGLVKGGLMFGGRSRYFVTRNGERWTLMRTLAGGVRPRPCFLTRRVAFGRSTSPQTNLNSLSRGLTHPLHQAAPCGLSRPRADRAEK